MGEPTGLAPAAPAWRADRSGAWLRCFCAGFATLVVALLLGACSTGPAPTAAPSRLRIAGSTSMLPGLRDLALAFQGANPSILVEVQGGDTANGWADLRAGRAEVASLSYWEEAESAPEGYALLLVSPDAVAVIVHPSNPITNMTAPQLRALFGGEILDWAALTNPEAPVDGETDEPLIVSREDGSGTRAAFEARVMGDRRVTLNAIVMPGTEAVVDYVASHRLAVGYVSLDAVDGRVRVVPVEGLQPDQPGYLLTRAFYLAARDPAVGDVRAFLDFARSPAAAKLWAQRHVGMQ